MLYGKLIEYTRGGVYPMHMPGHKRNADFYPPEGALPYGVDITEIDGFDNLHDPRGVLLETAGLAAGLYGSGKAFPLVNGSTAGILAAVGACAGRGDKILMARNCHMSVYNAAALFGAIPAYLMPKTDAASGVACAISPADVESALQNNPDTKLVIVTSPTYEGVISDVGAISDTAHRYGVPLLVDEAHGAHLGFSQRFQGGAVRAGADISVMSLHKTLPALTQCALLHVCGGRVDMDELARLLAVFQTSSPSYVLMASIDHCLRLLIRDKARLFCEYERNLDRFSDEVSNLKNLGVLCCGTDSLKKHPGFFAFDPGKLVIITVKTALSGKSLAERLRAEYKIELEMAAPGHAVAMTSICDSRDGFCRLAEALRAIDANARPATAAGVPDCFSLPVQAAAPGGARLRAGEFVPLNEAAGRISLEYVRAYPPGIPVITPGEVIDADIISYITRLAVADIGIKSTKGRLPQYIYSSDFS